MSSRQVIACVGDLVDDIVVWPAGALRQGSDTPARIHHRRGGSAANVASMVARIGGAARFVGCIGGDPRGDALVESLRADGVDVRAARHGTAPTGTVVVIVDPDGERSFLTDRGASVELSDPDPSLLDGLEFLHVPAYSLAVEPLATAASTLIRLAHERGVTVTIDSSSTSAIADLGVDRFLRLVRDLTPAALFANRDEAELLGLGPGRPAHGADATIVRHGADQTLVVATDGSTTAVPVPPVADVVDTTGAGDGFAAGWLVARTRGDDVVSAVAHGHAVAARVLRAAGADLAPG